MGEYKQQQQQDHDEKYELNKVSDLSKKFSEGKIKVYDYMTKMTTGDHKHAEAYKGLLEAKNKGLVSAIVLIKNDENYESWNIN